MDKAAWVAIIGSISGMVLAMLASLYGLGEHAPGVVSSLLVSIAFSAVIGYLVWQLNVARTDSLKRETDYADAFTKVALFMQAQAALEQGTQITLQKLVDKGNLESRVAELELAKTRNAAALAKPVARDAVALAEEVKGKP
jgi:uncharacterized protein YacL